MLINGYFTWTLTTLEDAEGLCSRIPSSLGALKSSLQSVPGGMKEGLLSLTLKQMTSYLLLLTLKTLGHFIFF